MEFKRGGDGGGKGKEEKLDFHYRQAEEEQPESGERGWGRAGA